MSEELAPRLSDLSRAIDNALVAGAGQRVWLKVGHPPLTASMAEGLAHYGGMPGAAFDLWVMCKRLEELRVAWTGRESVAEVVDV